jgi:ABC-type nitrate/sulfonate/bicarbonate transport system substrate-binding protein
LRKTIKRLPKVAYLVWDQQSSEPEEHYLMAAEKLMLTENNDAATRFIDRLAKALGWEREGPEEIVSLEDMGDEILSWLKEWRQ